MLFQYKTIKITIKTFFITLIFYLNRNHFLFLLPCRQIVRSISMIIEIGFLLLKIVIY